MRRRFPVLFLLPVLAATSSIVAAAADALEAAIARLSGVVR